jgi:GT2 family glycosyltransferase
VAAELIVQIVNYATKAYLRPCLAGVLDALEQTPVASRVLVLDNASGDDLSDLAGELAGRVEFHAAERNLGFGAGQNLLAARGDSRLLCCLNPDVVLDHRDVFTTLLAAFEDERVAVAGPLLRTPSGDPQRWDHGELHGLRARVANGAGHAHWRARTAAADVAWVSGAFLVARRDAFAAAGGFDEGYFLYKEEEDLCLRVRRAGGRVRYVPEAQATHVGSVVAGRDPAQLAASTERYMARNFPSQRRRRLLDALYTRVTRRI